MIQQIAPTLPQPERGESQADFAVRFHTLTADAIPETDRRNATCFQVWRESVGPDDLERRAAARFGRDHQLERDVPVFAEHTTKDRDGNTVIYDRSALKAIMDRCNHRIADTENYAPITEGHTPDSEAIAAGAKMPEVLGYAGPYRLGMIGNKEPRWAIFADEWHDKADVPKLRKMRRRSPEVWVEDRMEDRFFDPIAALGAEAPRLDMGMTRFCLSASGRVVEKYSAAAVSPSAMSTFVPGTDSRRKDSDNYQSETGIDMISPEDINSIVEAILQTPQMQYVTELMDSESGGMGPLGEEADPAATPGNAVAAAPEQVAGSAAQPGLFGDDGGADPGMGIGMGDELPEATPQMDDMGGGAPGMGADMGGDYEPDDDDREMFSRYMAGDTDEDELAQYMCDKRAKYMASASVGNGGGAPASAGVDNIPSGGLKPASSSVDQYSRTAAARLARENRELAEKYARMEKRVNEIEYKRERIERYSKLQQLGSEYAFDIEREAERCDPKKMTKGGFEDHCVAIVENYQKIPISEGDGKLRVLPVEPFSKLYGKDNDEDRANRAEKYCMQQRAKGINISFAEALEAVS
jgi:hypothetical protein